MISDQLKKISIDKCGLLSNGTEFENKSQKTSPSSQDAEAPAEQAARAS